MKITLARCILAALSVSAAGSAIAAPIVFTHSTVASGFMNGVNFTDAAVDITAYGDTEARQSCSGSCYFIVHDVASVRIGGLGEFSFVSPTRTFANVGTVGFSRGGANDMSDLLNGPYGNVALQEYDLLTEIAPISGQGLITQWGSPPMETSGGILYLSHPFEAPAPQVSFSATLTAVPEPSTMVLGVAGLLALGVFRANKRCTAA